MANNKPTETGKFNLAPGRWQTGDVHGDDLDRVIREAPFFAAASRPPIKVAKGTKCEPGEA
jgi:hypothetical protein